MAAWDASKMPSLSGKLCVVTGANSGIGFQTALELANKEAHVILACRNAERGLKAQQEIREETHNVNVEFMQLDVGSFESVRAFSQKFHERFDHLDVLINNAGALNPTSETNAEGFEPHFCVNYLGPFLLTSLLFDLLKASKEARIVYLSSMMHFHCSADFSTYGSPIRGRSMKLYGISKLAINLHAFELDRRIKAAGITNIKAVAVHPGAAPSNGFALPMWLANLLTKCVLNTTEMAAYPSLYAATDPSIEGGEFIGPSGFREVSGPPARTRPSKESLSEEEAKKLWAHSEELLHIQFKVE